MPVAYGYYKCTDEYVWFSQLTHRGKHPPKFYILECIEDCIFDLRLCFSMTCTLIFDYPLCFPGL